MEWPTVQQFVVMILVAVIADWIADLFPVGGGLRAFFKKSLPRAASTKEARWLVVYFARLVGATLGQAFCATGRLLNLLPAFLFIALLVWTGHGLEFWEFQWLPSWLSPKVFSSTIDSIGVGPEEAAWYAHGVWSELLHYATCSIVMTGIAFGSLFVSVYVGDSICELGVRIAGISRLGGFEFVDPYEYERDRIPHS